MLNDDDIKKLSGLFATKEELFRTKEELRQGLGEVRQEMAEFEHRLNTTLDKLYKELLAIREDQSVHRQEHDDINGRLDKIESIPTVAHELKLK